MSMCCVLLHTTTTSGCPSPVTSAAAAVVPMWTPTNRFFQRMFPDWSMQRTYEVPASVVPAPLTPFSGL